MSLKNTHPDYSLFSEDWEMIRDFYAGAKTVRQKGTKYLPATAGMRLDGMEKSNDIGYQDYIAYRDRARVPEYVKEGIEALVGLLHQKEAIIELPQQLEYLREKASSTGEPLKALHRRINVEQITTGRLGLLGDLPEDPDPANLEVYIALYCAESIRNWNDGTDTSPTAKLTFVILDETGETVDSDFFWSKEERYRLLMLSNGTYTAGKYSEKTTLSFEQGMMKTPMVRGSTLDFIPFVFINSKDLLSKPDDPPLKGLAELCKGIYQAEADYRQALHMQSQDTLVVIGGVKNPTDIPGQPDVIRVGAGSRIDTDVGGDAKYIGVSADGLSEQRTAIDNDRKRAEIRSGQLIQNTGSQMESGRALSTRFNAQTATLNQLAWTAADGLAKMLRMLAKWIGADENAVKVTPNTEFIDFALDGANIKALIEAKNAGFPISLESLHAVAADRGLTSFDYQTESKKIEEDTAMKMQQDKERMQMQAEFGPKPAQGAPGTGSAKPPTEKKPPSNSPASK